MRLCLDITTAARELPWGRVLAPGRGIVYDLLGQSTPVLGAQLHADGWGTHGMVPFGYDAPQFPGVGRRRGVYSIGGTGTLEFGSPLPQVVEGLAGGFRDRDLIDWGGTAFRIAGVRPVAPPSFQSGRARMRTGTPVVLKVSGDAAETRGTAWVLPTEPEFPGCLLHNLRRKAETLGLEPEVELIEITWVGPQRSFVVGGGKKPGAAVEVELSGDPQILQALWSWGLGQANAAGFGWVRTAQ